MIAINLQHATIVKAQPPRPRFGQDREGSSFDLRNAIIPKNEIRSGGPPKDGIPALTNPTIIRA